MTKPGLTEPTPAGRGAARHAVAEREIGSLHAQRDNVVNRAAIDLHPVANAWIAAARGIHALMPTGR